MVFFNLLFLIPPSKTWEHNQANFWIATVFKKIEATSKGKYIPNSSNSGCVGDIDDIFSLYFSDYFLTLIIDLYKNF